MRLTASILVVLLAAPVGCTTHGRRGGHPSLTDSGTHGGTDSGPIVILDGGHGTDSGPITFMDSGPMGHDSGPIRRDSGPVCAEDLIEMVPGTYCSMTTYDCIQACSDSTCETGCLDADANPDCHGCVSQNSVACFNRMGCQRQWDYFNCCLVAHCPTPTSSCAMTYCSAEDGDYGACVDGLAAGACSSDVLSCFGM